MLTFILSLWVWLIEKWTTRMNAMWIGYLHTGGRLVISHMKFAKIARHTNIFIQWLYIKVNQFCYCYCFKLLTFILHSVTDIFKFNFQD